MENMPPALRRDFVSDLCAAKIAVCSGHVSSSRTSKLYAQWTSQCADLQIDHRLQTADLPVIDLLQMYEHRVRNGRYSKQSRVRADSVAAAWRAVAEVHLLEGLPEPRKPPGSSSKDIDKRLSRMLRHYSYQDPPSSREKTNPLGLVISIAASVDGSPKGSSGNLFFQVKFLDALNYVRNRVLLSFK